MLEWNKVIFSKIILINNHSLDVKSITFNLFDTPEKGKYKAMATNSYENTKVIIFVYDITWSIWTTRCK